MHVEQKTPVKNAALHGTTNFTRLAQLAMYYSKHQVVLGSISTGYIFFLLPILFCFSPIKALLTTLPTLYHLGKLE